MSIDVDLELAKFPEYRRPEIEAQIRERIADVIDHEMGYQQELDELDAKALAIRMRRAAQERESR